MKYSLEELCTKKEDQVFDRKSARKDAKGLSNHSQFCLYAVPVCDRYSIPLCMVFLDGGLLSGTMRDEGTPCIQLPMPGAKRPDL